MNQNEKYIEFFLNCPSSVVRLECIEVSHPAFSQSYYVVRNAIKGVTVKHEDGKAIAYEYYPLKIKFHGLASDLDFKITISLGDLGELIPSELARIKAADMMRIKPKVIYRSYRSDVLSTVLDGPYTLEAKTISYNSDGCSFEAKAATVNTHGTGEVYDLVRFYPLRGFIY